MTDLKCCVKNCASYENNMCCKNNIKVDGKTASKSEDTFCSSFIDKDCIDCAKNSTAKPRSSTDISCDATNCIYNSDMRCMAENVSVEKSKNTSHGETECATFRM